jgi:hypothetical protein
VPDVSTRIWLSNDFRGGACAKALKAGTYRFKDLCRLLGGKHHAWHLCRFAINKKATASVGQMMSM